MIFIMPKNLSKISQDANYFYKYRYKNDFYNAKECPWLKVSSYTE